MLTRTVHDLGATVTFRLVADRPVSVVGDFNGWNPLSNPLSASVDGTAAVTVLLPPGRFAFRYLADGGTFFDEPEADLIEANGWGDSHSVVEIVTPVRSVADDLERIEGIGPKIAAALRSYSVNTFIELASSSEAALRQAIGAAGMRFAPNLPSWSPQAALLADGDEIGFVTLVDALKAGRAAS
jgi:hypothetical protein